MSVEDPAVVADQMRREFDTSFQRPHALDREREVELLAIRAGGMPLAVRTLEVSGVLRCPSISALPSSFPAFLGVCRVRGTLVAAYDLSAVLGGTASTVRRWMLLCGPDRTFGIVIDELEGARRAPASQIPAVPDERSGELVPESVALDGTSRPLLRIPALIEAVARSARPSRPSRSEERW